MCPTKRLAGDETRPWQVMLEIEKVARRREGVMQASGAELPAEPRYPVAQGVYNPAADTTQIVPASSSAGSALQLRRPPVRPSPGMRLYDEGLKALETQDREGGPGQVRRGLEIPGPARSGHSPAAQGQADLPAGRHGPAAAGRGEPSPLEQVNSQQEVLRQKLYREILAEEKAAKDLAQRDPRGALANLQKLRERVSSAEVEPAAKKQLLTIVDRMVNRARRATSSRTRPRSKPTSRTMPSGPASSATRS